MVESVSINYENFSFDFFIHSPNEDVVVSKFIKDNKVWEDSLSKIWLDSINEGDLVIDIGANIGWYSKIARMKGAEVIAFEPDPRNFEILKLNCPDCILLNYAVGDSSEDLHLTYSSAGNYGDTRPSNNNGSIKVKQTRLDDIINDTLKNPKAIKIDVQGWEPYVISGGKKTFESLKKGSLVLLEFCPSLLKKNKFDTNCFDDFFSLFSTSYGLRKNKKVSFDEMFNFLNAIKDDERTFYVDTINFI